MKVSSISYFGNKNLFTHRRISDVRKDEFQAVSTGDTVSFSGKVEKIIEQLQSTRNMKTIKITIDDAIKIYESLGYVLNMKAGSHITVRHPQGPVFSLQIPHGGEKTLNNIAKRTLQCAVFEDLPKLIQSLHFHRA